MTAILSARYLVIAKYEDHSTAFLAADAWTAEQNHLGLTLSNVPPLSVTIHRFQPFPNGEGFAFDHQPLPIPIPETF